MLRIAFLPILIFAAVIAIAPQTASARDCAQMGFSVNDYGKEGPARDAQDLLDQHIKKTMAEKKITGYTIGAKSVSCKLFLDFYFFDEYTCTAIADVCWGKGPVTNRVTLTDPVAQGQTVSSTTVNPATAAKAKKPAAAQANAPKSQ